LWPFFIFVYGTYGAITRGAKTNFGLRPKIKQKTGGAKKRPQIIIVVGFLAPTVVGFYLVGVA
jgi:hypothetical protein